MSVSKTTLLSFMATMMISPVASANSFNDTEKQELENIFEDYLMNNPKVIMKSLDKFQVDQRAEAEQNRKKALEDNYEDIINTPDMPFAGNPNGDIVVMEFSDYNCGYCKKALPDVINLIDKDKNVKVLFVEFPILGPSSMEYAQYALAASLQGQYFEYHQRLMESKGPREKKTAINIAKDMGLDIERLEKDAKSSEVNKMIQSNRQLAAKLSLTGTPAFVVDKEVIGGYIPLSSMEEIIAKARENK